MSTEDATARQRRGRSIAMDPAEIDAFLAEERTVRVATSSPGGPHNTPLWFVWVDGAMWLYSIVRSQRWTDLERDPNVAAVVDAGHDFVELRGVEVQGRVEVVGEIPRTGAAGHPELTGPELLFARKYVGGDDMLHDERHGWLRLTPATIRSWDFRKRFA